MIKKYAADSIASEMFKLLKKTAMEEKHEDDAKDNSKKMKMEDDSENGRHGKSHKMEDDAMDEMADYLAEEDDVEDDAFDSLDDEIQSMHDHADDEAENDSSDNLMLQNEMLSEASDKNIILMKGLGKIEAGLRRKGESFAADLVRATAFDIQGDIIKEAEQKEYVLRNLIKMASSLESRGESLAADLCRVTINKINR